MGYIVNMDAQASWTVGIHGKHWKHMIMRLQILIFMLLSKEGNHGRIRQFQFLHKFFIVSIHVRVVLEPLVCWQPEFETLAEFVLGIYKDDC